MSEQNAVGSFCRLRVLLDKYLGVSSTYVAETGLSRTMILIGSIEDLDYGFMGEDGPGRPGSTFHDKKVRLKISTPVDGEFLQRVRDQRLVGGRSSNVEEDLTYDVSDFSSPNIFGLAFFQADLLAEKFELFGDMVETEPVEIYLSLPLDAFEGIRRQAKEAYESHRILSATMRLIGNALPPKPDLAPEFGLKLKDLAISKKQGCAIQSFEISNTRLVDPPRGRVEYLRPKNGEGYGVGLSMTISSVRYKLDVERPMVTSITCQGRITGAHGKPYQGAEVEANFLEHETNMFGEAPEQAYFGNFEYFPKDSEPEPLDPRLYLHLRYLPSDVRSLIQELVGPGSNAQVGLSVLLAVENAVFDGTSKMTGDVRRYGFDVSQSLVSSDLDKPATKADIAHLDKALDELNDLTESIKAGDEDKYLSDRPATKGDVSLLREAVSQTNAVPAIVQLLEYLQRVNGRIGWILWFSLGALAVGVANYLF